MGYTVIPGVIHVESPSQPSSAQTQGSHLEGSDLLQEVGNGLAGVLHNQGRAMPCRKPCCDQRPRNTKGGRNNHESDVQYEISRLLYEVPSELVTQLFKMAHLYDKNDGVYPKKMSDSIAVQLPDK
jgi:hypothetical protein